MLSSDRRRVHYKTTFEARPGYLFILMEGQESLEAATAFWEGLAARARASGIRAFLVKDVVTGRLTTTQHFLVSEVIARLFTGSVIAYVDPKQETIDNNLFGENVVVNRGVIARVFPEEAPAFEWLKGKLDSI
jgi:hypothetical protein